MEIVNAFFVFHEVVPPNLAIPQLKLFSTRKLPTAHFKAARGVVWTQFSHEDTQFVLN